MGDDFPPRNCINFYFFNPPGVEGDNTQTLCMALLVCENNFAMAYAYGVCHFQLEDRRITARRTVRQSTFRFAERRRRGGGGGRMAEPRKGRARSPPRAVLRPSRAAEASETRGTGHRASMGDESLRAGSGDGAEAQLLRGRVRGHRRGAAFDAGIRRRRRKGRTVFMPPAAAASPPPPPSSSSSSPPLVYAEVPLYARKVVAPFRIQGRRVQPDVRPSPSTKFAIARFSRAPAPFAVAAAPSFGPHAFALARCRFGRTPPSIALPAKAGLGGGGGDRRPNQRNGSWRLCGHLWNRPFSCDVS